MGIAENQSSFSHIEFSSAVKESEIKKQVQEVIFTPLNSELGHLKDNGMLEIQKNGTNFRLLPVLSDIYRFIATDESLGISEHITVTESFIEDKIVDVRSGKTIDHLWNSQQTISRVKRLLENYGLHETRYKQEVLFENYN